MAGCSAALLEAVNSLRTLAESRWWPLRDGREQRPSGPALVLLPTSSRSSYSLAKQGDGPTEGCAFSR